MQRNNNKNRFFKRLTTFVYYLLNLNLVVICIMIFKDIIELKNSFIPVFILLFIINLFILVFLNFLRKNLST